MRHQKLFYGSSYDRGLQHLLNMWADIKKAVPEATLDICYGWNLFDTVYNNNPERMAWKKKMEDLMSQDGITHHGRVGKDELKNIRESCGIWAYPCHFEEINCISALESQFDGLVPVVINYAALKETVGAGIKIDGDIFLFDIRDKYKQELISLMLDLPRWEKESKKAHEFASSYGWHDIAKAWEKHFR